MTEGSKLNINCDIMDGSFGTLKDQILWHKNGIPFTNSDVLNFLKKTDKRELDFSFIQLSHLGNYSCTLTNYAGSATQYIQVNVGGIFFIFKNFMFLVPPQIAEKTRKIVVKRGANAELWCEAVGIPAPIISWLKDGKVLPNG